MLPAHISSEPIKIDNDSTPILFRGLLYVSFVLWFVLLSPIYIVNRLHFWRCKRLHPLGSSWLVETLARWPLLYEVSMLALNFPLYDKVYAALPRPVGRVLQVGSGTGLYNRFLRDQRNLTIENVEPNARAIELGRKWKRFDCAVCGSITERLPFEDGRFDQILFARSFHHIHRIRKALKECLRLLAPGGRIVIFDPVLLESDGRAAQAWVGNSSIDGLIWRYTAASLVRLLETHLPPELVVTRLETYRQPHLTNFNLVVAQTDAVVTIERKKPSHEG
jgi:SAM-dependent methyltransferase